MIPKTGTQPAARARADCRVEPCEPRVLMALTPIDIEGVQPAALDMPRIHALLRRAPAGEPLTAEDPFFGETFDITAFYDTGASGVLVSKETADALGVGRATHNGQPVVFEDVGVGGASPFHVSEPLYVSLAPYTPSVDADNPLTYDEVYAQTFGPLRTQVAIEEADEIIGPLDVFGMPVMAGKVVVMDARPLNDVNDLDAMRTYAYNPDTPFDADESDSDPGIAPTNLHVDLSYAAFDRFTTVTPAGAPGPTLRNNPFIGPNPLRQLDPSPPPDPTPGLAIGHFGRSFTGSWLLDTGAAASIVSQHGAAGVGVFYEEDSYGSDDPLLVDAAGNAIPDQYTLTIGGIGGSFRAAGFFLDSMTIPTVEGRPVRYLGAPVLVADISVADPASGQELTLDGIFGMNFLVASAFVSDQNPFPEDVTAGAYDWIVFDEPAGELGLQLPNLDAGPTVAGRHVFYNRSAFDGNNAAANAMDDAAIATDKRALLPGQAATFANYTSYGRGINGVMVDITGLPQTATLLPGRDLIFKTGNNNTPSGWAALATNPTVSIRRDAGVNGSDRVTLTWPDNTIKGKWLQVTVAATVNTGLATPDVFYFGNAAGEGGNSATNALVSSADELGARANGGAGVSVTSRWDYNRDRRVNSADQLVARRNKTTAATDLNLITVPAAAALRTVESRAARPGASFAPYRPSAVWTTEVRNPPPLTRFIRDGDGEEE